LIYVETRWSEWLKTLSWVLENREKMREWLLSQKEAASASALTSPTKKNRDRYEKLASRLDSVHTALGAIRTRVQLALCDDLTLALAQLIKHSQNGDSVTFSRHVHELLDVVQLMRVRASDAGSLKAFITRVLSSEHLVLTTDFMPIAKSALENALLKFDTHAGASVRYLLAISLLDCGYWSCKREFPLEFPTEFGFLITSRIEWNRIELEWCAVGRTATMQQQRQLTERLEYSLCDTASFWQRISQEASAPLFGRLVERILSVQPGIADVERSFSKLRSIDEVRRNRAADETVEDEFWIASNPELCAEFSENHKF
jgi:hypothetical protein